MGSKEVGANTSKHKNEIMSVKKITDKVASIGNGLDTKAEHLKVDKIKKIYQIYDDITKLVSSYGKMVEHDLVEFNQLRINIQNTDKQGAKR
jgi:hypothetical protein